MTHHITSSFGSIKISAPAENILMAKPSGLISLGMIKEDFKFVNNYPVDGFDYYVDLTGFVIPNPLNLYYLRKLNSIPGLRKYILVTDSTLLKLMNGIMKGVLQYDEVIGSEEFFKTINQKLN